MEQMRKILQSKMYCTIIQKNEASYKMWREAKTYKALYFDLCVKKLEQHFSRTNPTGAYRKIQDYLINHNFSHEQYSGYHSLYKATDLEIYLIGVIQPFNLSY